MPATRAFARKKAEAAVAAFQASICPAKDERVGLGSLTTMTTLYGKPKESKRDKTQKSTADEDRIPLTRVAARIKTEAAVESITNNPNLCGEPKNKSKSVKKHILHYIDGGKPDALGTLEIVHTSQVEECKESRIRQRKKAKNSFFIHEDIVFNILVFLPAECLHNTMRHVTDRWAEMINSRSFIDAHLKHVKPVLYFRYLGCDHHLEFMGGQVPRIVDTGGHLQGKIWATCDGLLLHHLKDGYVEVLNPITMQALSIPCPNYPNKDTFAFTRVRHSGEFKVVRAYRDEDMIMNWCVLTLGSNEWRHIFPPGFRDVWRIYKSCPLISIGDFVFMTDTPEYGRSTSFIAMDLSEESFHIIKFPESVYRVDVSMQPVACHKMGQCLSLIAKGGYTWWCELDIYVMKDIPNGEWIKYLKLSSNQYVEFVGGDITICMAGVICGWSDDGRWLILKVPSWADRGFRVYDRKSNKAYHIPCDLGKEFFFCEQYTPSLVWWES